MTTVVATEAPTVSGVGAVYAQALRGRPCLVVGIDGSAGPLPVADWTRDADGDDLALIDHCRGPVLDIGCGPGRMVTALLQRGHVALGIDVVHEAVGLTLDRGGVALRRDVFGPLPREGRWGTALLADGNVGIGGDPVALLTRVSELIEPEGRIVVEVAPPGVRSLTTWVRLECGGERSERFAWSFVGCDGVEELAGRAGLQLLGLTRHGRRWCAVLEPFALEGAA